MTSKRRIAIAVAGLFLGAQIGMAALSEGQETAAIEGTEQESVAELSPASEPVEAATPAETAAAATEEQLETQSAPVVEIPQRNAAAEALAAARSIEHAFPSSAPEYGHAMLPALIAYLDSRDTRQLVAGPIDNVIPSSASEADQPMLPAMIAYFERREAAAQLAASGSTVVATAPAVQ